MTYYAAAEGSEPRAFDTEAEAEAHAVTLLATGKRAVVWEMTEGEK